MADRTYRFTEDDIGLWADGCYPDGHVAAILEQLSGVQIDRIDATAADWDAALEALQDRTESSLTWVLIGGDLILTTEDQARGL